MVAALQLRTSPTLRDDDLVPQIISWIVAAGIGAAWLLIVYLAPVPVMPKPAAPPAPPSIGWDPRGTQAVAKPLGGFTDGTPLGGRSHTHSSVSRSVVDAAGLFTAAAAAGIVLHISQFIPGVIAASGDVGPRGAATKSALSANAVEGTPGMTQMSRGNGSASSGLVGRVQSGASIGHADVHVRPLPIVQAAPLGAETADATEMGSFVRARVAQLQTCYERTGGTDLAGVVALRLSIGAGGAVQNAEIARRSWSGPGAAATESCLLNMVKGWRVPFASEGTTVTIPISFTRGS